MNDIENTGVQFKQEGQNPFAVETPGNENPSDSPTEINDTLPTPSSEGEQKPDDKKPVEGEGNFNDHPRWKERETDWTKRFNDQEARHTAELEKIRQDLEAKFATKETPPAGAEQVPSWFGGDEDQWKEFQSWNNSLLSEAEKRGVEKAMKGIEEKTIAEQNAIKEATDYFEAEVTALESDKTVNPQGEKVDRNKLLKFVLDNDMVDSKGRWNYKAGFLAMRGASSNPSKPNNGERRTIAGATIDDKKSEERSSGVTTSDDFNKPGARPW